MTPEQFTAALKPASPDQLDSLDQAHWRYISMIGLVSDVLPVDVVMADQKAYPQFIKQDGGRPVFNDGDCKTFMVAITGLSPEFCEAWRDQDFYQLHSETAEQLAARQFAISEPLCAAYCRLLLLDFTADAIRKQFPEENPQADFSDFEVKLGRFYDGLANNRLELAGTTEDVSGWLLCYIEAYVDPGEPEAPFNDWETLSPAEQDAVKSDAIRLSPILRSF